MGVKVLKFGGSSVADAGQLRKIKNIIESDPDRRYVVVSAPGKRSSSDPHRAGHRALYDRERQ